MTLGIGFRVFFSHWLCGKLPLKDPSAMENTSINSVTEELVARVNTSRYVLEAQEQ